MELTIDQALEQAVEAHRAGRLPDAERLYRAILDVLPGHAESNHNMGVLAVAVGKVEASLPFLKTALEADPKQGQFWVSYIDALIQANQAEAARQVLQQGRKAGLAGDPVDDLERRLAPPPVAAEVDQRARAVQLREAGRFQDAQGALKAWLVFHPGDGEAWSLLSQVCLLDNKEAEAESALATAGLVSPDLPSVHRNRARLLLKKANPIEALQAAQSGHDKAPEDAESWLVLAACLSANQSDGEALSWVGKALEVRPTYAEAFVNRALIRVRGGNSAAAMADAETALSIKPHLAQVWALLGSLRFQAKDLPGAIEALQRAHDQDLANAAYMVDLGEFLRQARRTDEAIAVLERATAQAPHNEHAWSNLGVALQQAERAGEARAAYEQALAINPQSAEIASNLGALAKDAEDWEAALHHFDQALAIKPGLATLLSNRGAALVELGRIGEAEASFREAVLLEPDNAQGHRGLGLVFSEHGPMEDATASYRRALELRPHSPENLFSMADHALFLNDADAASALYEKTIAVDPGHQGLKAMVNLAILDYTRGRLAETRVRLADGIGVMNKPGLGFKNYRVYWEYLKKLVEWSEQPPVELAGAAPVHVIGESHSLSSQGVTVRIADHDRACRAMWMVGCKQWHLGNPAANKYKHLFQGMVSSLPPGSTVLLAIGEIDCRHDEGILKHSRQHPEKDRRRMIEATVGAYLDHVHAVATPFEHAIIVQGVPSPNLRGGRLTEAEAEALVEAVATFNAVLMAGAKSKGYGFLDIRALTDRGDGWSNAIWHIDEHHLSPAGIEEAWRLHYHPADPITGG